MKNALLEHLEWDEDDGPTLPSGGPAAPARRSSRNGWLVITGEGRGDDSLACAAPTLPDAVPDTYAAPDTLESWIELPPPPSSDGGVGGSAPFVEFAEADDDDTTERGPSSVIRPLLDAGYLQPSTQPPSTPLPLVRNFEDDEQLDERDTDPHVLSLAPQSVGAAHAEEIARLRRWLYFSVAVTALAIAVAVVALAMLIATRRGADKQQPARGTLAALAQPEAPGGLVALG